MKKFIIWGVMLIAMMPVPTMAIPQFDYITTYFDGKNDTGLRLAGSNDGCTWTPISGIRFNPQVCNWKIFRDPSFAQGPDGTFHLVWTTGSNGFGYASSTDLINWSNVQCIPINRGILAGTNRYTWAPEVYWDENRHEFILLFSTATRKLNLRSRWPGNFKTYFIRTTDFVNFTDPKLLFDPHPDSFYNIDAALIQNDGTYYVFVKLLPNSGNERVRDGIHWATASSLEGPWSLLSAERLPGNQDNSEAPSPIEINHEYIVYWDLPGGLHAARSLDLKTWTDISDRLDAPADWRHGTIRRIVF